MDINIFSQPLYNESVALWAYALIIVSALPPFFMSIRRLWVYRAWIATLETLLIGASLGLLLVSGENIYGVILIVILQAYRLFSILRVIKDRVNPTALRNRALRSELFLSSSLLLVVVFMQVNALEALTVTRILTIASLLQFIFAVIYLQHALATKKTMQFKKPNTFHADVDLPSLTIAIPARNETDDLAECLVSILESNYPKLEILVLDDCSQDRTSEIIKNFAHRGVRFLSGKTPPGSWLAKNYAYHQLLDEAGGKYVLFCGTDVRFDKSSVRNLMEYMVNSDKKMASILPNRKDIVDKNFLLQPMRYWKEVAIPNFIDKSPPSLSTCWVVKRGYLEDMGAFEGHKKTIRPEKIISRNANHKNQYAFLSNSVHLGISSVKKLSAQWQTAVRTHYPEVKNRPENVLLESLIYLFVFFGSFVVMVYAIINNDFIILAISVASLVALFFTHYIVTKLTNPDVSNLKALLLPLSVILEIIVANYSMWAYEFSNVVWKGRNVCIPVLTYTNSLPKLTEESLPSDKIGHKNRKR